MEGGWRSCGGYSGIEAARVAGAGGELWSVLEKAPVFLEVHGRPLGFDIKG